MNKNIVITLLIAVILLSTITLAFALITSKNNYQSKISDSVIVNKNMAIDIGDIVLKYHFPEVFKKKTYDLDATYDNGIWTIYNLVENEKKLADGSSIITQGGGYFVEISEKNGEIINIGIND